MTGTKMRTEKDKRRLNLELTAEMYEQLQQMASESGRNMSDILRLGLALYNVVREENQKGRKLAVVENEKIVKEIVTLL